MSSEVRLAQAVVLQALIDVGFHRAAAWELSTQEYKEAYLFLTARTGEWARTRREWCCAADISEADLMRRCKDLEPPEAKRYRRRAYVERRRPSDASYVAQHTIIQRVLEEGGLDILTCHVRYEALPYLLKIGYLTKRGNAPTHDIVWNARDKIRKSATSTLG